MTSGHTAVQRIRLAVLSVMVAGLTLSVSAAERGAPGLEDAAVKAEDVTKKAKDFGAQQREAQQAKKAAAAPMAAAAGPIQCKCSQWGAVTNWVAQVCVRSRCRNNDPDDCRCLEKKAVPYEQSSCQAWTPNFCNE